MAKKDLNRPIVLSDLTDLAEAILGGVQRMFDQRDKRFDSMDKRFDKVEKRLDNIEADVTFIKRDINDIKADLSLTPTKEEFERLKRKLN